VTAYELVLEEQAARVERGMCACGCPNALPALRHPRMKYLDGRHRERGYSARVEARMADQGIAASGRRIALSVFGGSGGTGVRRTDAESRRQEGEAPRPRRRRTELRVPYRRAVDELATWLEATGELPTPARRSAEMVLTRVLTPRQRAAVAEARHAA
jgi:hypothetical protein